MTPQRRLCSSERGYLDLFRSAYGPQTERRGLRYNIPYGRDQCH